MPVTAKLSREFYEKFGDELTTELVDLLNQVDAVSRADLRELNELNFARFDAKLEQRLVALEARVDTKIAELRGEFRAELAQVRADFRVEIAAAKNDLVRWMFALWLAQMTAFLAFWIGK